VKEIWEQAILIYNLPLTILLIVSLGYWVLALIGTIDFEALDFDFDPDIDPDIDVETDVTPSSTGFLVSGLKFVNAAEVPLMMILSFLTLFMWVFSVLSNYYLNPSQSGWVAFFLFIINFFLSALAVKAVTQPLLPFFKAFKKGEDDDEPVIGRVAVVKSRTIDQKYGQIEVPRNHGAPAIVNARMGDGHAPSLRGDRVLVFDIDPKTHLFLVRPSTADHSISETTL